MTHQQYITLTASYHPSPPYLQQVHIPAGSMLASISLTLKQHYRSIYISKIVHVVLQKSTCLVKNSLQAMSCLCPAHLVLHERLLKHACKLSQQPSHMQMQMCWIQLKWNASFRHSSMSVVHPDMHALVSGMHAAASSMTNQDRNVRRQDFAILILSLLYFICHFLSLSLCIFVSWYTHLDVAACMPDISARIRSHCTVN